MIPSPAIRPWNRSAVLRYILLIFLTLVFSSLATFYLLIGKPVALMGNADLDLTPSEISTLAAKANKGDGDDAWRLWMCYDMARSDQQNAEVWLNRAAILHNPNAERVLADAIKNRHHSPGPFGASGAEAYLNLLESAARTDGSACYELASSYAEGDPLPMDPAKARFYYAQGASLADRTCWVAFSKYLHMGKGGRRDDPSAYYWIGLETRCVHPDSIGGKEEWAEREEIAKSLSLEELKFQWTRIDKYIDQVRAGKITVPDPPFGKGEYFPDESAQATKASDERENQHRKIMESRGM
jgi:TPR repeat protein